MSRAWHHEQTWSDSCVAACGCIVQKARGLAPTEAALRESASPRPLHPLGLVLALPRTRVLSGASLEREIPVELATGALAAIVTVLSCPYVLWQQMNYPSLHTRHGRLASPARWGGPLHAIALVARSSDGFLALDPYFVAHDALAVDDDAFASFFGGHAAVADR